MSRESYSDNVGGRIAQQLAESAITDGDVEDHGASALYPLQRMDERARFISALLRIERLPNTEAASGALGALKDMGVVREIGTDNIPKDELENPYDAFDNEYAGLV